MSFKLYLKKNVFSIVPNNFGFGEQVKYVIKSDVEGELNSGKMMHALLLKAMKMGIEIKTGYNVSHYETKGNHVLLHNETLPIEAKKIAICTNAFAQKWFSKQFVIEPGRGQVFITEKIPSLAFKGIFHFDEGYYYFRVIDQRILFGGGRNKDFNTEQTHMLALNDTIQKDLEEKLKTIILPNQDVTIAQRWSGIMAFGDKKMPIIEAIDEKVFVAIRFGGMGVAIGSKAAEILSKLMLG